MVTKKNLSSDELLRDAAIARVLEDTVRRRATGEQLSDETVISAHRGLMPTLAERLNLLHKLDMAELRAQKPESALEPSLESPTETQTYDEHTPKPKQSGKLGQIGRFHIKRELASGGMGTVYEAEQEQPRRSVAVKVMKYGISSAKALRRFEYESQLLGRLRHPNIAQIYEAGTHESGSSPVPYFAMEFIPQARLLTQYARENRLSTRERLALFIQVCDGVHHGHQKGIIHRDLKPGNILVDQEGRPKIIDFGVARSTDSDTALTTMQTDVGQLIGTLQYMSPEQCAGDPHDIDIRSDVYALGVVLYELLCGTRPYDVSRQQILEAARIIQEQSPTRPSTINRTIPGELETICLKALEKDRERRYASAADFATDIRKYLAGEAIAARPASVAYQLRVFARRNKAVVTSVAVIFLVLLVATVVSTSQYFKAQINAERSDEVATILKDMLGGADPNIKLDRDAPVLRDLLDQTAKRVDGGAIRHPGVEGEIRFVIGKTYYWMGRMEEAERMLARAAELQKSTPGNDNLDLAQTLHYLATLYQDKDRFDDAKELEQEVLAIRRKHLGPVHPELATSINDLAFLFESTGDFTAAEPLYREAIAMRRELLGSEELNMDVATDQHFFTVFLHNTERLHEAEQLCKETLGLYRRLVDDPVNTRIAALLVRFGAILQDTRKLDEAERVLREGLDMSRKLYGGEHARVAGALNTMASVLREKGEYEKAEPMHREALAIRRKLFGNDHTSVGYALDSLGLTLTRLQRYQEAEESLTDALRILSQALGIDHHKTQEVLRRLVTLYEAWQKPIQAAEYKAKLE